TDPNTSTVRYYLSSVRSQTDVNTPADGIDYTYHNGGALHGLMEAISDPFSGGTATYEYYPNRRAFRVTDPQGKQETFAYDHFHNVTRYSNARGESTAHQLNSPAQ